MDGLGFKKGSQEAKDKMARLRAMKGTKPGTKTGGSFRSNKQYGGSFKSNKEYYGGALNSENAEHSSINYDGLKEIVGLNSEYPQLQVLNRMSKSARDKLILGNGFLK